MAWWAIFCVLGILRSRLKYLVYLWRRSVALSCFAVLVISELRLILAATDQALRHALLSGVILSVQQFAAILRRLSAELPLSRLLLHLAFAR